MQLIAPSPGTPIALKWNYVAKAVLTESEIRFHEILLQVSQSRCHVLCKPRLADFLDHLGDRNAFNKISQKHVDFLICRLEDRMPIFGIELDDNSHNTKDRRKRDMFVNMVFAQVGLPLLRIDVQEIQQIEQLVGFLTLAWQARHRALA